MEKILSNNRNTQILLGNEAIVRGALEAGVNFVSTYPGTPASEIGNIFYRIAKDAGVYFEFSTNEKVALEASMGASYSGLKTLVAMKNFGLNVCSDALIPFVYTGTKGACVIIGADDPSCHSSAQSEENTRAFSYLAHIPTLEPSDPKECKDFTELAFKISDKFKIPVLLRTTTRVAHQRMPLKMGKFEKGVPAKALFIKNPSQFITFPPRVLEMKEELLEKINKIKDFAEESNINKEQKTRNSKQKIGIITSGVSYLYIMEALERLGINLPVLKLGFFYPLPEEKIKNFIKGMEKILVVEELEPYLEKEISRLSKDVNCKLKIFGKDLLPETGELKPELVIEALAKITGKKYEKSSNLTQVQTVKRMPQLCPGCPYWAVISAVKKALPQIKSEVVFGGEIGCYMLFGQPAIGLQDYLSCMGSSVGIAHGIGKALQYSGQANRQKTIAFVGDSSFFHSGIPALINTVFNRSDPLIIILNNQTTAMTGHQPHPVSAGTDTDIKIENIVKACGVKNVKTIDPSNQEEFSGAVKEFLEANEVAVIIAKHPCKFVKP